MKNIIVYLIIFISAIFVSSAQVTNLVVEKYYVSDANDATDTLGNFILDPGTNTYRVFVELESGSKLRAIYGDANHLLKIESTQPIYNNIDRPNAVFGYQMNKNWFDDNATIALDSWLTLGIGAFISTTQFMGVLKSDDTDGSFLGGINNEGGTAFVPGGILINNDPTALPALTTSDGLVSDTTLSLSQWSSDGFKDFSQADTTVFGVINTGSSFTSNNCFLRQNNGLPPKAGNRILVAQITTKGQLSLKLNLEILQPVSDTTFEIKKYVADNTNLQPGEILSPYLTYPPLCGCKDPQYLEYNPIYACNIQDSCQTLIRFGCMDTTACNFDPSANFNLQSLCCYPGYCNDRDLSIVCPGLANGKIGIIAAYPNPAESEVTIEWKLSSEDAGGQLILSDMFGKPIDTRELSTGEGMVSLPLNDFPMGLYMVRLVSTNAVLTTHLIVK
jgi:hypothetical protein